MAKFLDVARFTPTLGGTTDWTVSAAVTGYQTPASAGAIDGQIYRYRAESADLSQWEVGYGAYTASGTVLARTTVLFNSSGTTSKISFTVAPTVGIVPLGEDLREKLDAARTYYVRSDGSDSNTGLVDSAGGGFLTVAKALAVVAALDCSIYVPTITIDAGTWTVPIVLPKIVGTATPVLTGVGSTTIISVTANDGITNDGAGLWQVNNVKLTVATSGNGITIRNGGAVKFSGVEFGTITGHGIACFATSSAQATGAFSVSGGASSMFFAQGYVNTIGQTVTFSNAPAYSAATFYCFGGYMDVYSMVFTNGATVTGTRYSSNNTGAIFTNAGGATYVPGSIAGTTSNGGIYA